MKSFRKSVCVFCGARDGSEAVFRQTAFAVGQMLANNALRLVYGGSKDGLMGATADGVLSRGGQVLGVLPKKLATLEVAHPGIQEMRTVDTMAQRKDILIGESEAFVILPGGLGTLDEFFEVLTANTLGFMDKPVIILNTVGYYTELITWMDKIADSGLSRPTKKLFVVADDLADLERLLA